MLQSINRIKLASEVPPVPVNFCMIKLEAESESISEMRPQAIIEIRFSLPDYEFYSNRVIIFPMSSFNVVGSMERGVA